MDVKTALVDTIDPRPIKKVTTYAFGTLLEGIAVGIIVSAIWSDVALIIRIGFAGACFLVGAFFSISAYSQLKRKYQIVERSSD